LELIAVVIVGKSNRLKLPSAHDDQNFVNFDTFEL